MKPVDRFHETCRFKLPGPHPEEPGGAKRSRASRRMAACTAIARGHPSQGDARHRPETHRLRDAPQDEAWEDADSNFKIADLGNRRVAKDGLPLAESRGSSA